MEQQQGSRVNSPVKLIHFSLFTQQFMEYKSINNTNSSLRTLQNLISKVTFLVFSLFVVLFLLQFHNCRNGHGQRFGNCRRKGVPLL